MQIVIDIPEEAYNLLTTSGVDWLGAEHILDAVAKGIPLPKGHGKLIDADALYKAHKRYWREKEIRDLRNAPTVIEAYNTESEG